jgi:predicted phosphodiesterase
VFKVENVKVIMIHIGGYPGAYDNTARLLIEKERPKLFVCGHSHILRIMYDKKFDMLVVNPGAAGKFGLHKSFTAVRFVIDGENIRDMEVLDIPRK